MKKILQKGFTLIELLIVIGILGILVGAVLLAINPAEGQRKARDTKRMKDLSTLQAIMDQAVSDGLFTADINVTSSGGTFACATNWLGVDICKYANTLPIDPLNKSASTVGGAAGTADCTSSTTASKASYYYVSYRAATGSYEINIRQESTSNCGNLENDGGNSNINVEAGTDTGLDLLTDN